MSKKITNRKVVLISATVMVVVLTLGFTLALWSRNFTQTGTNTIETDCFDIQYSETDATSLVNAYPQTDEDGLKNVPYTVTIENTCDTIAAYTVLLNEISTNTLAEANVKVAVNDNYKMLNAYDAATPSSEVENASSARKLLSAMLPGNTTRTISVKSWMNANTTELEGENKTFAYRITVDTTTPSVDNIIAIESQELSDALGATPSIETLDANLTSGWAGGNGLYISQTGYIYEVGIVGAAGSIDNKGTLENPTDMTVFNIASEADINEAKNSGVTNQIWNIKNDFTLTKQINVSWAGLNLIVNGNGHTITGSDDTTSNFIPYMFNFAAPDNSNHNIIISNLNVLSGYKYRSLLIFNHGNIGNTNAWLSNVTINHSKGTSQNDKYGAAIVNNSSNVVAQNNFSIISGERAWAAVDMDNTLANVSFTLAENSNVSFTDNRSSAKKEIEPFIGFSNEDENNTITFTNLSSYPMESVTKNGKAGYDLAS